MKVEEFNNGLLDFLDSSPTPFHATAAMVKALTAAGFQSLSEGEEWSLVPGEGYFVTRNDSSIVAFRCGDVDVAESGWRMAGAHTDSPCLKVKPNPVLHRKGYFQLGVEVYGGALLHPWFDRDLGMAGRVSYRNTAGRVVSALVDSGRAIASIPSLAIHLDREANNNRTVNPQTDLPVLLGCAENTPDFTALLVDMLSEEGVDDVDAVLDYELSFYDCQCAALIGLHGEFIASARLDNLLSCYIGLQALLEAPADEHSVLVCNDHEEVGSMSSSGAQGPMLESVLRRIAGSETAWQRAISRSLMISADNAHGVHPNFSDRHDANHGPLLNQGAVIKINVNQRYATNSETSAMFRDLCARAGQPVQSFVVRSDMACGSTIGPITASALGVPTLDVGVPTFAMHSIRELAGRDDAYGLSRVLSVFYRRD
ncbi:MAG: M18 family aminopeptidase, partial [Spongiibacter sp.]|nr:M18 family aminopeptidase [Spongiibacter sp.]